MNLGCEGAHLRSPPLHTIHANTCENADPHDILRGEDAQLLPCEGGCFRLL